MVISLNHIIFIQMIGFLTLLFILNFILYKPILKVIRQRKETVDGLIKEANDKKSKAAENENIYSMKLEESEKGAKEEYNKIIASAMNDKEEKIRLEIEKAKEFIETKKQEVSKTIALESKKVTMYSEEIATKIYEHLVS